MKRVIIFLTVVVFLIGLIYAPPSFNWLRELVQKYGGYVFLVFWLFVMYKIFTTSKSRSNNNKTDIEIGKIGDQTNNHPQPTISNIKQFAIKIAFLVGIIIAIFLWLKYSRN